MNDSSSGVASSAAKIRSPSFSRSASSTTTTALPALMSAMARSMDSKSFTVIRPATSFSTYFAMRSTSMFTVSPGLRTPRVVCDKVVGISATTNVSSVTSATVSDTPSTAMEPFSTT